MFRCTREALWFGAGAFTSALVSFFIFNLNRQPKRPKRTLSGMSSSKEAWQSKLDEDEDGSVDYGYDLTKLKKIHAGAIDDAYICSSLPFTLLPESYRHAGVAISTVMFSKSINETVLTTLNKRIVAGLETDGVSFFDIIDILVSKGQCRVYVYGGFLRDLFVGVLSDDIDLLFKSRQGNPVPYLKKMAEAKRWPCYTKTDERSGGTRWDFLAIGTKGAKTKFSGHECGTGCEGEFTMNTLQFDVITGTLIDPTGMGVYDAVDHVLRIPYGTEFWDDWLKADRLKGMRLLRYFNFCGRGYQPAAPELRQWVVGKFRALFAEEAQGGQGMVTTLLTFLNRKIFVQDPDKARAREAVFRGAVVAEMAAAGVAGAEDWYKRNITFRYMDVKKNSSPSIKQMINEAFFPSPEMLSKSKTAPP